MRVAFRESAYKKNTHLSSLHLPKIKKGEPEGRGKSCRGGERMVDEICVLKL